DDRCLPATTIVVGNSGDFDNVTPSTTADDVAKWDPKLVTLREAIHAANNSVPGTVINFDFRDQNNQPTDMVIKPKSALPSVTADNVTIDTGNPKIGLDGSLAPNSNGLVIQGDNCHVYKLYAYHFDKAALVLSGANDSVDESTIGADISGSFAPNG